MFICFNEIFQTFKKQFTLQACIFVQISFSGRKAYEKWCDYWNSVVEICTVDVIAYSIVE